MISTILKSIGEQYAAYAAAVDRAQSLLAQQRPRTLDEQKALVAALAHLEADKGIADLLVAKKRKELEELLK